MKRLLPALVLIAMVGFTVFGWGALFQGQARDTNAYYEYLEKGDKFKSKGIYIEALNCYEEALKLSPKNREIIHMIADMYYALGDSNGFITTCDQLILGDPLDAQPYIDKINFYIEKSQYSDAVKVLRSAQRSIKGNEEIDAIRKELSTKCIEKYVSLGDVQDWFMANDKSYIVVGGNDKWGIVKKDGSAAVRAKYEYIGSSDEEMSLIPVCSEGIYCYVDPKGNRRLIGDEEYSYLGAFRDGIAAAQREGLYGYIDKDFNEYHFEYDYAGSFLNGVAAVKKEDKWALINKNYENITDYIYDEILVNAYGFCSEFELVVAKQGEKYMLLDLNGKQIGQNVYDEAALPASTDSLIAVKQGDLWGFCDRQGEIVIEPRYQNAKSFSLGLAPVQVDEKWGFIDLEQNLVIDCKYQDAGVFSSDGAAPVNNRGSWMFLVLCEYDG